MSYSWRSLWSAKSLLLEGMKWRVGNGDNISVWQDAWFPGDSSTRGPTPSPGNNHELRVADLIDRDLRCWKNDVLVEKFTSDEVASIKQIPLSFRFPADSRYWWPTKDGVFTVKSAYWLGTLNHLQQWEWTHETEAWDIWQKIWNLDVPPKLKHFLWRAYGGCLAVSSTLGNRHIIPSKNCSICEENEETIMHALFDCSWTKTFWLNCEFKDRFSHCPTEFRERLQWIFQNFNKEEIQKILAWIWGIWAGRNDIIFSQGNPDAGNITGAFFRLVTDYCAYAPRVFPKHIHFQGTSNSRWIAPELGVIKINSDAALIGNDFVGLGAVLRNHEGAIVAAGVSRLKAKWPVVLAEMAAARWGMLVASRLGFTNVHLESDALEVVRMIKAQAKGFSHLSLLVEDIHHISRLCTMFSISHVRRAGNSVAHLMARFSPSCGDDCIFLNNFPQGIVSLAEMDVFC